MDKDTIAGLALVVSIIAGGVSIFSLAATTVKLKLDLYNRRFKIYEDVLALYQVMYDEWDDENVQKLERAMIRSFRESRFLFHSDDGIYDIILKFKDLNAKNSGYYRYRQQFSKSEALPELGRAAVEARIACDPLIVELEDKLMKYLDFRKISGWT
jgi:hypothetical protein